MDEPAAEAYRQLERLRWGGAPDRCPHCAAPGRCALLPPRGGVRRTRTGAPTGRLVWKCGGCGRQFSVLTGTVLAGTRLPLPVVLAVLAEWGRAGRPTASELTARYGITGEAARHLLRRVDAAVLDRRRTAAAADPSAVADPVSAADPSAAAGPVSAADPLTAVLDVPPEAAARIRGTTPARRRPRRQTGPTTDHGTG